jgi:ABC-type microcin C transport system permease subunit YejB
VLKETEVHGFKNAYLLFFFGADVLVGILFYYDGFGFIVWWGEGHYLCF